MYYERERQVMQSDRSDPMIRFKFDLTDLFRCISLLPMTNVPVRFGVKQGDLKLLFMITGLFLEPSSHNIVAEIYVVERKPNTSVGALVDKVDCMLLPLTSEQAQFWRAAVPAMIERCRDWEHRENCEHNGKSAGSVVTICSCGMGKSVSKEFFENEEWADLGPYVTHCALSPVFPAPYVEQTRSHAVSTMGSILGLSDQEMEESARGSSGTPSTAGIGRGEARSTSNGKEGTGSVNACQGCGRSESTKKCGRCKTVYYCGKNCQAKDSKRHKPACQQPTK